MNKLNSMNLSPSDTQKVLYETKKALGDALHNDWLDHKGYYDEIDDLAAEWDEQELVAKEMLGNKGVEYEVENSKVWYKGGAKIPENKKS